MNNLAVLQYIRKNILYYKRNDTKKLSLLRKASKYFKIVIRKYTIVNPVTLFLLACS